MMYQVMIRASAGGAWAAYAAPTAEPYDVVLLIQAANQQYAEVTVLQAESAKALAELLRQMRGGVLPAHAGAAVPGFTSSPRVTVEDTALETRRWEWERGPGGDHDEPYELTLPESLEMAAAWLRLMARHWREVKAGGVAM